MEEQDQEDNTQSSGSVISNLTDLEDDTDEFGKMLAQSERDKQRLNDALRGDGRAFSKARPKPGVLAVLENFERRITPEEPINIHTEEQWAKGSREVENEVNPPNLNVPREWGRKGKQTNDWLRRISASEQRHESQRRESHRDNTQRQRVTLAREVANSPSDERIISANDTLHPTIEQGSSPFRASFNGSTPPSIRQRNTSLDKVRQWELEEELSMQSFLASTPAIGRNNKRLDDIREREIANLKGKAVTTSRLDEIAEKMPEARPLRKSRSREAQNRLETINGSASDLRLSVSSVEKSPSHTVVDKPKLSSAVEVREQAGEAIPNTPIVVYKSSEKIEIEETVIAKIDLPSRRPEHQRQDSRDLLRHLARATSGSPAPAREIDTEERRNLCEQKLNSTNDAKQGNGTNQESTRSTTLHQHESVDNTSPDMASSFEILQLTDIDSTPAEQEAPEESTTERLKAEVDACAVGSTQPSTKGERKPTPLVDVDHAVPKTPVVTGAWVDTPRTTKRQGQGVNVHLEQEPDVAADPVTSRPASEFSEDHGRSVTLKEPEHPKSALAAVVQDARSHSTPSDDFLGESTIESLEDIIDHEHDLSSLLNGDDPPGDSLESLDGASLSPAARQRALEMLVLERMDRRLRAARTSIRDANRGMKRVERKVEAADENNHGVCPKCGCPANGKFVYSPLRDLWTALRSRFWTWDGKRRLRFTWLGLACLLFLVWFLSEATLCEYYCHPLYAERVEGFGVDPSAPRMPYVTITILSRPLEWLWGPFYDPVASFLTSIVDFFLGPDTEADSRPRGVGRFGIIKNGRLFESWPSENSYTAGLEYEAFRSVVRAATRASSRAAATAAETLVSARQMGAARVQEWSMGDDEVL